MACSDSDKSNYRYYFLASDLVSVGLSVLVFF